MSPDQLDTLEQQRRDADRRYNDALTAFDAALVRVESIEPPTLAADASLPPVPGGWRGRSLRVVSAWLLPWLERQQGFNARTAAAIEALTTRERERAGAFAEFQHTLVALFQQITAFVETKDRLVSAQVTDRFDPLLATVPELRVHLTVLQRATAMLQRRAGETAAVQAGTAAAVTASAPATGGSVDDYKYVGFEDQFRGSEASVAATFA